MRRLRTAAAAAAFFWAATFAALATLSGAFDRREEAHEDGARRITEISIRLESAAPKSEPTAPPKAPLSRNEAVDQQPPNLPAPTLPATLAAPATLPTTTTTTTISAQAPVPELAPPTDLEPERELAAAAVPEASPSIDASLIEPATAPVEGSILMEQFSGQAHARPSSPAAADLLALDATIRRNLAYPAQARKRGVEGTAIVEIEVDEEGRLLRSALSGSSGSGLLDAAALRLVAGLFPFRGLGGAFTTRIAIEYRLD